MKAATKKKPIKKARKAPTKAAIKPSQDPPTIKPKQKQLGKTKAQVKLRARKIAAGLIKGQTAGEAIRAAGYSEATAHNPGEILQNPLIKKTYCEILDAAGATDEAAAKVIADAMKAMKTVSLAVNPKPGSENEATPAGPGTMDFVEVDDHPVRLKAVEQLHRIRGRFQDKVKVDLSGGLQHGTDEDLLNAIKDLGKLLAT